MSSQLRITAVIVPSKKFLEKPVKNENKTEFPVRDTLTQNRNQSEPRRQEQSPVTDTPRQDRNQPGPRRPEQFLPRDTPRMNRNQSEPRRKDQSLARDTPRQARNQPGPLRLEQFLPRDIQRRSRNQSEPRRQEQSLAWDTPRQDRNRSEQAVKDENKREFPVRDALTQNRNQSGPHCEEQSPVTDTPTQDRNQSGPHREEQSLAMDISRQGRNQSEPQGQRAPPTEINWNPDAEFVPRSQMIIAAVEHLPTEIPPNPTIPMFYGDARSWSIFKRMFNANVNVCDQLTTNHKIACLRCFLNDGAFIPVDDIPFTAENYEQILNRLEQTYENPSAPVVRYDFSPRTHNPSNLVQCYYYYQEVLDYCFIAHITLSRMNFPHLAHYVAYDIVLAKLNPSMCNQLLSNMNPGEVPSFERISGFLQWHIQRLSHVTRVSGERNNLVIKSHMRGKQPGLVITTLNPSFCTFCQEGNHKLFSCLRFLELSPADRTAYIKANNRCFNCLGERHSTHICLSDNVCAYCKLKHHTLLHDEETPPGQKENFMSGPVQAECVLLPTASLTAYEKPNNTPISIRALLDLGSQCNLITEKCRAKLNLPLLPLDTSLSGSEEIKKTVLGTTVIKFSPYFNVKHVMQEMAYVVSSFCAEMPAMEIPKRIRESFTNIGLADPKFDIPGPIDFLIGEPSCLILLKKSQYRCPDTNCFCMETYLGWVVLGKVPLLGPVSSDFYQRCAMNSLKHTVRRLQDFEEYHQPETPRKPDEDK